MLPQDARGSFVVWSFLALLVSWLLFFIERRATLVDLQARLRRTRDLQVALDGLSELRSEGVNTSFVPHAAHFEDWVARFRRWEQRVVDYIGGVHCRTVGLFSELVPFLLSTSPMPLLMQPLRRSTKILRMLAKELAILRESSTGLAAVHEPNPTVWKLWQRQQGG
jgi:heme exporter protein D